jgi:hypothetical protein
MRASKTLLESTLQRVNEDRASKEDEDGEMDEQPEDM